MKIDQEASARGRSFRVLPGQYFDLETGKHYNYFRDYDPAVGRYFESDPIGLIGGRNTFSYSTNRPLTEADALGLLITSTLNGISRDPLPPGDASGISNFATAATFAGAGGVAVGAGISSGGGAGAAALGEAMGAAGTLVCRVVKDVTDPCQNAMIVALFGLAMGDTMCKGKSLNSLRNQLERRDEIRRAVDERGLRESNKSISGPR